MKCFFRRRWLLLGLGAVLVPFLAGAAATKSGPRASAKANPNLSDEFFERGQMPRLFIEVTGTNLSTLKRDNRHYVHATVKEGTNVYEAVGLHLKGAAGSFRGIEDRPALTLNFNKFRAGQYFHGLDKIALNNSVQDPAYMTEILCGELFLAANVPTPRGSHARVNLNGRDLGLYVLKEGFDKTFLRRHFKNTQGNLYDGGFLREITEPLDRTSGSGPLDYADLKALVKAAQESDPDKRLARLETVLDLDRFLSFVALEAMTYHWDGYTMKRNNYRIYFDPDVKKTVFLPHGMDQMFWEPNAPIIPPTDALVARAVLSSPEGSRRYLERCATLVTNVFRVEVLTNRINELQARIRPALAEINPDLARQHDGAVDNLRLQIIERVQSVQQQIAATQIKPVKFDVQGCLRISAWTPEEAGGAVLDKVTDSGKPALHIRAPGGGECTASWRASVPLAPGHYRFEALARTAGVVPFQSNKGEGAGVRISGASQARTNKLTGNSPWTKVEHEFAVPVGIAEEVLLVCELRATQGEAWFEVESLKLWKR